MVSAYHRKYGVKTRIARIFNTYGPRMRENDGRVVPNLVFQALSQQPLTVYGDGSQTRSFCYVSDLVEGIVRLFKSNVTDPVNIGNPDEFTVNEFAHGNRKSSCAQDWRRRLTGFAARLDRRA
jgi:nucleoside-diphosphate-sugar epimerase